MFITPYVTRFDEVKCGTVFFFPLISDTDRYYILYGWISCNRQVVVIR